MCLRGGSSKKDQRSRGAVEAPNSGAAQARARAGNWRPRCQVEDHPRGRHPDGGSHGPSNVRVAETAEQRARAGKDWEQGPQGVPGAFLSTKQWQPPLPDRPCDQHVQSTCRMSPTPKRPSTKGLPFQLFFKYTFTDLEQCPHAFPSRPAS